MSPARDTIFALSSGRPPAAIAVVRISGPRARAALEAFTGRLPSPRQATLARLRDPQTGEPIDEALALWFPSPRSETGEDMAELQLHGGRAVIAAVLSALGRLDGFRAAEAGEFTRRAFENGHLDLTAVEGLADLIGAETEAQRRQAFRQMKGMLGDQAETWRKRLIDALALVEAGIDFSDEADVPADLVRPALDIARALHEEISAALARSGRGERLRDGLVVAIAGPPNAGKSTLLNRIAKREAAIVSPFAGTTRDVIEVHLDLGGYPVTLLDTAGMRETDDPVEQEGVRRARERAASADLVLWVVSAVEESTGSGEGAGPLADAARTAPVWLIRNKADLLSASASARPLADEAGVAADAALAPTSLGQPLAERQSGKGVAFRSAASTAASSVAVTSVPSTFRSSTSAPGISASVSQPPISTSASQPPTSGRVTPAAASPTPVSVPSAPPTDAARPPTASITSAPAMAAIATAASTGSLTSIPATAGAATRPTCLTSDTLHHTSTTPTAPPASRTSTISTTSIRTNEHQFVDESIFILSAGRGIGVENLLEALESYVEGFFGLDSALITRERHRHHLEEAQKALSRASQVIPGEEEIVAEELRLASRALGRITGKVDVEDILDVIFRDFCIGK